MKQNETTQTTETTETTSPIAVEATIGKNIQHPLTAKLRPFTHDRIGTLTVVEDGIEYSKPVACTFIGAKTCFYLGVVPANAGGFKPGVFGLKGKEIPCTSDKEANAILAKLLEFGRQTARMAGARPGVAINLPGFTQKVKHLDPEERIAIELFDGDADMITEHYAHLAESLLKGTLRYNKGVIEIGGKARTQLPEWFLKYDPANIGTSEAVGVIA